jgi:hypothetical protein
MMYPDDCGQVLYHFWGTRIKNEIMFERRGNYNVVLPPTTNTCLDSFT